MNVFTKASILANFFCAWSWFIESDAKLTDHQRNLACYICIYNISIYICIHIRHVCTRTFEYRTVARAAHSSITRYGHAIASGILSVSRMRLMIVTSGEHYVTRDKRVIVHSNRYLKRTSPSSPYRAGPVNSSVIFLKRY